MWRPTTCSFPDGRGASTITCCANEAYSLFRKRRPEGETEELQPETLEGAATVGGNTVFPVELTLAVSSALGKLTADQRGDSGWPGFHVTSRARDG